jgi:methyl-accepting chemotaxis protein
MPTSPEQPEPSPGSGGSAPTRGGAFRLGLTLKIVGLTGLCIAIVAAILGVSFGREVKSLLRDDLTTRGRMAALALANTSATLLFANDVSGLDALATATLADVPGAAYVVLRDEAGEVLAEAAEASLGAARPTAIPASDVELGSRSLERAVTVGGREMLHLLALVTFKGKTQEQYLDPLGLDATGGAAGAGAAGVKVLGTVEIGFPIAHLNARIAAASRRAYGIAAAAFAACLLLLFPLARVTTRPLAELSRAALGIAEGDLRQDVRRSGNDEVADLGRSFARMVGELQGMLGELKEAAGALAQESDAMLSAATRQAAMASQQSAAVAEMDASMREIAQTAAMSTEHADRVIEVTRTAEASSRAGEGVVEEAVGSTAHVEEQVTSIAARLGDLSSRVSRIGDITASVKDLAAQSNILALNAAIQAGRGGEAGAGFVVIAREMRTLAEQSAGAAGQIPRLLSEIVASTQAAAAATAQGSEKARSTAELARRAGSTIGNLTAVCRESAEAARYIAESSRQQATGVNEVVTALGQLASAAEGSVEGSEEMRRVAERLKSVSGRLTRLADRYRN